MPILLIALLLCSCSPKTDNTGLPNYEYGEMQAAEDAGRTPASSQARPETGGGK